MTTEKARYDELCEKKLEQDQTRAVVENEFKDEIKPQLQIVLDQLLLLDSKGELTLDTNVDIENPVQSVRDHLKNREIEQLGKLIMVLDSCNDEIRKKLSLEEQRIYFEYLITTYLFDNMVRVCGHLSTSTMSVTVNIVFFFICVRKKNWK